MYAIAEEMREIRAYPYAKPVCSRATPWSSADALAGPFLRHFRRKPGTQGLAEWP